MNMIKFFSICLFLIIAFFFGILYKNTQYVSPEYVGMAQKIRAEMAKNLSNRHHMQVIGISGGMMGTVNILGLDFQIPGPLTKDKLRKILIDCVEEFLVAINADEKLRPFLKNYPFTEKEIEIVIFVSDKNGRELYDPDISVASAVDGKIYFNTVDKNKPKGPYKEWFEEDYETAKAIVQKEQGNS